jgi:hypothetical protein
MSIHKTTDHNIIIKHLVSLVFLQVALIINYYAVRVATERALHAPSLEDVFFDILPYFNTHILDYWGALFVSLCVFFYAVYDYKKIDFFIRSVSLLIIVRAFFINLTALGIPPNTFPTQSFFTQGGDLFFSGHTALPFMAALVFWENKKARISFLLLSLIMAAEVLVGRHHYSIDVFSAPFFAYGVYKFSLLIFEQKKRYDIICL